MPEVYNEHHWILATNSIGYTLYRDKSVLYRNRILLGRFSQGLKNFAKYSFVFIALKAITRPPHPSVVHWPASCTT